MEKLISLFTISYDEARGLLCKMLFFCTDIKYLALDLAVKFG